MIQPHSRTKPLRKQGRNRPAIEIISQIHRERAIAFRIEAGGEIRIAQYGISNPALFTSAIIRVFPSFEHSAGVSAGRQTI